MILAYTPDRHPELPNVPAMVELGKTEEQKQVLALYATGAVVGRSIMGSPGIPADRVQALRAGFDAMLKDKDFLAEIKKTKAEFDPMSGEKLQAVIVEAGKVPEKVREMARTARGLE